MTLLGYIVRSTRGERSLRDAAKEAGVSPATMMRIEHGREPDIRTLVRLSQWTGYKATYFIARHGMVKGPKYIIKTMVRKVGR